MMDSIGNLALARTVARALQSRFSAEVVSMSDLTKFEEQKQAAVEKLREMDRDPDELIGTTEILQLLESLDIKIQRKTIHRILKREAVPVQTIGSVIAIRFAEIENIIEGLKTRGGQSKS